MKAKRTFNTQATVEEAPGRALNRGLKLFRAGQNPVIRGTAFIRFARAAFL
jgi:hypothetical protein